MPSLRSWSHSRLTDFEKCKHRVALKHIQKIPEPERPLPPGKTEHANDRGSRIHNNGELYVRNQAKLCPELAKYYRTEFDKLQALFPTGQVFLEDEWGMDSSWEPCDWKEAWLRLKIDALVFLSPTEAVVIDYKTGRREGNEIKHGEQVQLYQLVTFLRYPQLETITVELWYTDIDDLFQQTYRRDQGLRFQRRFNERGMKLTTYDFTGEKADANPNVFSCKWCMYGKKGSGVCKRGL